MNYENCKKMKIYVLHGFAPDPSEQCICTFADVFSSEADAREKLLEIKNDTEMLLEDSHNNGCLDYYSVEHHNVMHNQYTLGSFNAKASISPGNKKHEGMWRNWSAISLESSYCVNPNDVCLKLQRASDFTVASISIGIKEI